jgi:hypothetical protein
MRLLAFHSPYFEKLFIVTLSYFSGKVIELHKKIQTDKVGER